jgi:hypothetical protein
MVRDRDKKRSPPLHVVGDAWGAAHRMLVDSGKLPSAQRAPLGSRTDGQFGLGDGPPGMLKPTPSTHQPGGRLLLDLQGDVFRTVERLKRNLPEEGFFSDTLSPTSPFEWTILAYQVPVGQQLWLTDYSFSVGRQSGIDAGDFVYAEEGRFSGVLGFDVTINGMFRTSDLEYGLDPTAIPRTRAEYNAPTQATDLLPAANQDQFDASASESFASTAGPGTSLLPVRPNVQGPRGGPFTMVISEGDYVALRCVVFRPVRTPIAFIEGRLAGFTLHTNVSRALIQRMRPQ